MNKNFVLKYVWQFLLLLAAQVLLMNRICLWGYLTPMLYVMFILTLPFQTPRWLVVLLGFAIGFGVDCFSGIMGVHAAATTLIAFMRPMIINLIPYNATLEEHQLPTLWDMHFGWFAGYTLLAAFIHQFMIFFLDSFSLVNFFHLILISVINSIFTTALILIVQCLFYNSSKRY